jgi:hypothetical protein
MTRFVAFWAHQAADYFFGAGLIVFASHASGGMVYALEAGGAAWCLLNALTKGPAGLVRILGRRVHAVLDVLLAVGMGISPLLVYHHLDWVAVGFTEAVVLVQLRLATWTAYDGSAARVGPAAVAAPAPSPASTTKPTDQRVLKAARIAGWSTGRARRGASTAGAKVGPAVDGMARGLGRAAGAAKRAGGRSKSRQPD